MLNNSWFARWEKWSPESLRILSKITWELTGGLFKILIPASSSPDSSVLLPWTQLLWSSSVAQLGGGRAGFQCRRRTTHETIVIDYTHLDFIQAFFRGCVFTFLISFKNSQVWVISFKKRKLSGWKRNSYGNLNISQIRLHS